MMLPTHTQVSIFSGSLPTIEPTLLPGLLEKAFSLETVVGINGHHLVKITGWRYGFRQGCNGYQWLDSDHLILFPSAGEKFAENHAVFVDTLSVVINLETKVDWLPPDELKKERVCNAAPWSAELGLLVFPEFTSGQETTSLYTADGEYIKRYWEKLIDVSPSGTKLLVGGDTWIDLVTGKTVDFAWSKKSEESIYFPRPIWSSDETRVFTCCYHFGDARTSVSYNFPFDHVTVNGRPFEDPFYQAYGAWVRNDSYLLTQWDGIYGSNPGFIPLYDPAANTLRNLNQLARIPTEEDGTSFCQYATATPDGKYVWVNCYTANYLVNLSNYQSVRYPGRPTVPNWSTNSKFAWMESFDFHDESLQVLSVDNKTGKPLPIRQKINESPSWHPTDPILAYLSVNQTLIFLNATDMSVQEMKLGSAFQDVVWSPNGDRIALAAANGSIWQVDYPALENLEQLTIPMPDVRDVFWAPDGYSIAFVGGSDIFVVDPIPMK